MNARELMTAHPATITGTDTVVQAAQIMRTRDVGMLPVVASHTDPRLIGILTDRDIVVRFVAPGYGSSALVREHMTREPIVTVAATDSEREIGDKMTRFQVRRLPVVDSDGRVIGVVAQADLALSIGPKNPLLVEQVLESISRPGALMH